MAVSVKRARMRLANLSVMKRTSRLHLFLVRSIAKSRGLDAIGLGGLALMQAHGASAATDVFTWSKSGSIPEFEPCGGKLCWPPRRPWPER